MFVVDVTTPQINFEGKDASAGSSSRRCRGGSWGGARGDSSSPPSHRPARMTFSRNRVPERLPERLRATVRMARCRRRRRRIRKPPRKTCTGVAGSWRFVFWTRRRTSRPWTWTCTRASSGSTSPSAPASGMQNVGVQKGALAQEAAHSYLLRQVFKPCRMDLDFTTHIPEKMKIARGRDGAAAAAAEARAARR